MNKNKKKQIKPRYLLWFIICLCLFFIAVSLRGSSSFNPQKVIRSMIVPMEKGLNSAGQWISERSEHNRSVDELVTENEALKAQIEQLNAKISSMENNLSELDALRDLLKMKEVYPDYDMVGARIISKDAGNWYHNFIIDKGSEDGIKKDMNVIYDNGLVGIVYDVSPHNASAVSAVCFQSLPNYASSTEI